MVRTQRSRHDEEAVILLKERHVCAVGADTIACEAALANGVSIGTMPGYVKHRLPNGVLILKCVANLHLVIRRSASHRTRLWLSTSPHRVLLR